MSNAPAVAAKLGEFGAGSGFVADRLAGLAAMQSIPATRSGRWRSWRAGRVWTNCYHQYPAHAAFGGYKSSGVGRENHRMMLEHYSQTKCLLVSYDPNPMGFF